VRWRPAVDATKVILGAQAVAITALLTIRTIVWTRHRRTAVTVEPKRGRLRAFRG
jgi:hypothetical protein